MKNAYDSEKPMKKVTFICLLLMSTAAFSANRLNIKHVDLFPEVEKQVDISELQCLALNIYHEARNEDQVGRLAVAFVTLNRVKSVLYPDTICDVVWQKNINRKNGRWVAQFSWTLDGKPDRPYNIEKWLEAVVEAGIVYRGYNSLPDPTKGSTHYHADYVNPYWSSHLKEIIQIGSHIFYKL